MLEIQLFLNFEKVAIIFVQSIIGVLCGMIADLAFFPQIFCVFPNANKINKCVNTKAFVIVTILWEKWCIINRSIFDHDCIILPGVADEFEIVMFGCFSPTEGSRDPTALMQQNHSSGSTESRAGSAVSQCAGPSPAPETALQC